MGEFPQAPPSYSASNDDWMLIPSPYYEGRSPVMPSGMISVSDLKEMINMTPHVADDSPLVSYASLARSGKVDQRVMENTAVHRLAQRLKNTGQSYAEQPSDVGVLPQWQTQMTSPQLSQRTLPSTEPLWSVPPRSHPMKRLREERDTGIEAARIARRHRSRYEPPAPLHSAAGQSRVDVGLPSLKPLVEKWAKQAATLAVMDLNNQALAIAMQNVVKNRPDEHRAHGVSAARSVAIIAENKHRRQVEYLRRYTEQQTGQAKPPRRKDYTPKRPLSAYNIFFKEIRDKTMQEPEETRKQKLDLLAPYVGNLWHDLPQSEKDKYEELAHQSREKYDADMLKFQERLPQPMLDAMSDDEQEGEPSQLAQHRASNQLYWNEHRCAIQTAGAEAQLDKLRVEAQRKMQKEKEFLSINFEPGRSQRGQPSLDTVKTNIKAATEIAIRDSERLMGGFRIPPDANEGARMVHAASRSSPALGRLKL